MLSFLCVGSEARKGLSEWGGAVARVRNFLLDVACIKLQHRRLGFQAVGEICRRVKRGSSREHDASATTVHHGLITQSPARLWSSV